MQMKTPVQEIMEFRDFINNLSVHQSPIEASPTRVGQVLTSKLINGKLEAVWDDGIIVATGTEKLISGDIGNELTVGSDNKLLLETNKLQTSFNYASSVSTFWSI